MPCNSQGHREEHMMRKSIVLHSKTSTCTLQIQPGLFNKIPAILQKMDVSSIFIITDSKLKLIVGTNLLNKLQAKSIKAHLLVFPAGEKSKSISTFEHLTKIMIRAGADRSSLILAIGGGVVTDMAGFVAATFMRGIPYINVPTTLLGMVDASIGGKTGVDLSEGKNLVGAFHHPHAVFIDPLLLKTLPAKEFTND